MKNRALGQASVVRAADCKARGPGFSPSSNRMFFSPRVLEDRMEQDNLRELAIPIIEKRYLKT